MNTELLNLLEKLIAIKSVASNKDELNKIVEAVETYLKESHLNIQRFESSGFPSLLICSKGHDQTKPFKILFNAHLDVVPAPDKLFNMHVTDNKAFGRGVYDMKGAAAAMLYVFKNVAIPNDIGLQLVTDEEIGGADGTKYQLEKQNIKCEFFIGGEPTNLNILHAHKGLMQVTIKENGVAAHGSRPWEGKNANIALAQKITDFYEHNPLPTSEKWETTYSLNELNGGVAMNVVSPSATAGMDIRCIDEDTTDSILAKLKQYFTGTEMDILLREPGMFTDINLKNVTDFKAIVDQYAPTKTKFFREHFATDGRFYSAQGIPAIHFGLTGGGIHQDTEFIELDSLNIYTEILEAYIKTESH